MKVAKLRYREEMIRENHEPDELTRPIIEVIIDGDVVGELPATHVSWEMNLRGFSEMVVKVAAKRVEMESQS